MLSLERPYLDSLRAIRDGARGLAAYTGSSEQRPDAEILDAHRIVTDARRALDAVAAELAGAIAHRSRRELGYSGLAQREGFRTAEKLVQHGTGSTAREAATMVTVGTLAREAHVASQTGVQTSSQPWLLAVGLAVQRGSLSLPCAAAIRVGLGVPAGEITADHLGRAVTALLVEAATLDADEMLVRARRARDDLDVAGVALREEQIREERSFRRVRRANGLHRYILDPDIEGAAFLDDLYDRVTAPRRGNVTFLSEADQAWADKVAGTAPGAADSRSMDQYVHDTITDLLRIAVATDTTASRALIGSRQPAIRVLVTGDALRSRTGIGYVEGISTPVSIATVERLACSAATVQVSFDAQGNALDVGREQRLFTARQRIALASRDGGCRMPGCDRPPGWCEAHHIDFWERDDGSTDTDRGVLLCRHHHMLMHNNGWEIKHDGAQYWLIPPRSIDAEQVPRPMPSKSGALRELLGARRA